MSHHDEKNAECLVYTFKEGMLSAVAHDLKLRVERFTLDIADDMSTVSARFDARSLRVVCAMAHGREASGTLSAADRLKIEENVAGDVLHVLKYPEILFRSTKVEAAGGGFRVQGELTLCGRTRSLTVLSRDDAGKQVTRVVLHQPDFGIKPFSAMLGTLKVKPDLEVELRF